MLNRGESYIEDVPSETLQQLVTNGLRATTDYDELRDADAILIFESLVPFNLPREAPRANAKIAWVDVDAAQSRESFLLDGAQELRLRS